MLSDGPVGATLFTKSQHQAFFCLVGFWSAADVSASCLAVGDGLKGSLSDELPFHFSQASKQSDEDRRELPQPFGVDEFVGGSDADASFLEVIVSIKVAR